MQDSSHLLPSFSPVGRRPRRRPARRSAASDMLRARHRDLRSDFLLVKSPETDALVPFRDVIEVDGVAVRDREARLAKLFLNATPTSADDTMARAERIREEGARYNLGNMRSTLGNPVLGARRAAAERISSGSASRSAKEDREPRAGRLGRRLQGSRVAGDDSRRSRPRSAGARPAVDRHRDRPRAQDRAAGRSSRRSARS